MTKVETSEWLKMLSRMIRAAGKRVAEADEPELFELVALKEQMEQAVKYAVQGQRSRGSSWNQIGEVLGISRQGAFRRYGGQE